jgi:hypothetical protein
VVPPNCYAGCDSRDVLVVLRRRGLLDDREPLYQKPSPVVRPRALPPDSYEQRQHEKAAWLWSQRRPIAGSIAEKYLREIRNITCPLPATLAYLPPRKPEHHPAMIATFGFPDEPEPSKFAVTPKVDAVHLTLLRRDGSGKADVEPNKIMVGTSVGERYTAAS